MVECAMLKNILALLFALFIVACTKPSATIPEEPDTRPDSGEGRQYISDLAAAIRTADRIIVTEHSNVNDVLDEEKQPHLPENYEPVVYASHELTQDQRSAFLLAVVRLAQRTQDAFTACIFEPHHTIAFYRAGKQTSAMVICFQCGEVQWDGTAKVMPWSLVPGLRKLVSGIGMHEKRDWYALVRAQKK